MFLHGTRNISTKFPAFPDSCDPCGQDIPHSSVSASLSADDDLDLIYVSEERVVEVFSHLKCGKADGTSLLSDILIYVLPVMCTSVRSLFTGILGHGYMSQGIRNSCSHSQR